MTETESILDCLAKSSAVGTRLCSLQSPTRKLIPNNALERLTFEHTAREGASSSLVYEKTLIAGNMWVRGIKNERGREGGGEGLSHHAGTWCELDNYHVGTQSSQVSNFQLWLKTKGESSVTFFL